MSSSESDHEEGHTSHNEEASVESTEESSESEHQVKPTNPPPKGNPPPAKAAPPPPTMAPPPPTSPPLAPPTPRDAQSDEEGEPENPTNRFMKANNNVESEGEGYLSVKEGDIVVVLEIDEEVSDYARVQMGKEVGLVAHSALTAVSEDEVQQFITQLSTSKSQASKKKKEALQGEMKVLKEESKQHQTEIDKLREEIAALRVKHAAEAKNARHELLEQMDTLPPCFYSISPLVSLRQSLLRIYAELAVVVDGDHSLKEEMNITLEQIHVFLPQFAQQMNMVGDKSKPIHDKIEQATLQVQQIFLNIMANYDEENVRKFLNQLDTLADTIRLVSLGELTVEPCDPEEFKKKVSPLSPRQTEDSDVKKKKSKRKPKDGVEGDGEEKKKKRSKKDEATEGEESKKKKKKKSKTDEVEPTETGTEEPAEGKKKKRSDSSSKKVEPPAEEPEVEEQPTETPKKKKSKKDEPVEEEPIEEEPVEEEPVEEEPVEEEPAPVEEAEPEEPEKKKKKKKSKKDEEADE